MQFPMIGIENISQVLTTEVKKILVKKMSSLTELDKNMFFERGLELRKKNEDVSVLAGLNAVNDISLKNKLYPIIID